MLKKLTLWTLMVCCLLIFSGCSTKPTEVRYRDKVHVMPDRLLVDPCEAIEAGETLRSLAKGYVTNTSCVGKYMLLLEKQRKYKAEIEAVYNE